MVCFGAMLERTTLASDVAAALKRSRIVALLGPRQTGKTTLARTFLPAASNRYFDLEDPLATRRLAEPMTELGPLRGLVVIDEVQRRPEIFPTLRVLADRRPLPARFLILGSATPELLRQSSESLAGRVETIAVGGFSLAETGVGTLERHWLRGGFPRAFLARTAEDSFVWRREFVATFNERDLPQLGVALPAAALLRFWTMIAHYHGGVWNAADPARSLGVSEPTVRKYLDLLSGLFVVRQLPPWNANLGKRQVRAPKVYLRDSGLLNYLLGVRTIRELLAHPRCGASWEGYALEETLRAVRPDESYFWATHQGAELDLLMIKRGKRLGVEFKRADAPGMTASMRIATTDLELDGLAVVYPGKTAYEIAPGVRAVPLTDVAVGGERALFPR